MSAPMSMEEWQNRLRAQKQQERQNKTQASETLHNYRKSGLSDEDELLRKIRLEEQQKKKEAAELLNSYRPNVDDMEGISPRNQQQQSAKKYDGPEPVTAPTKDDPRASIAAGSVSNAAASFNNRSSPTAANDDGEKTLSEKAFSEASTERAGEEEDMSNNSDEPSNPIEEQPTTKPTQDVSQSDLAADWVDVKSEEFPPRPETPEIYAEKPLQGHPTLVRLDVDFSFGLISTKTKPILDAYMQAVEEVVLDALEENKEMKQRVSYNPHYQPFVEDIQKDASFVDTAGRENVYRLLVRAAVPVFLTNGVSPKQARSWVIKALQKALKKGIFRNIGSS